MRGQRPIAAAAVLGLAAAGWWLVHDRAAPPAARAGATPEAAPSARAGRAGGAWPSLAAVASPREHDLPPPADERALAIAPDQVLALVNGVEIKLGDLMTVEPDAREARLVDPEALRYLLDRAIDRELVGQAARAAGVELDREQQAQLDEERQQLDSPGPGVISDRTRTPAYVAFDVRDSEGLMLQANLVAAAGAPPPYATGAQVDAYYQAHRADHAALPADPAAREAAWATIEVAIRDRLAESQGDQYRRAVADYLRDLRARASVTESDLVAGAGAR